MNQIWYWVIGGLVAAVIHTGAWDYEVHRAINRAALECLPPGFPKFVRSPAGTERICFLAGEPDRWYNSKDRPLRHVNAPDHYIDLEEVWTLGFTAETLPPFRYVFVREVARRQPRREPSERDEDRTRSLIGFLPWSITEQTARLKSCFSYLKAYEQYGTPEEVDNARQNVLYVMGLLGHMVGDATQPLHTTIHYNGWTGHNPNGYTTNRTFHRWIDADYIFKTGGVNTSNLAARLRPAQMLTTQPDGETLFRKVLDFVLEQNRLVEPLYRLEKEGKLSGEGSVGLEGRKLIDEQLARAAQFLADLWYTAYVQAPEDSYLIDKLKARKSAAQPVAK